MMKYVENEGDDTRVQRRRLRIQNGGLLRGGYDTVGMEEKDLTCFFMLLGTSKRKLKLIKIRDWPKSLTKFKTILYQPR